MLHAPPPPPLPFQELERARERAPRCPRTLNNASEMWASILKDPVEYM